jgi:glycosidase
MIATPRVRAAVAALAALLASAPLAAQAPTIQRLDPPSWWAGHSVNPVRVMVRGTNLAGARVNCGSLRCGAPRVSASGTTAFVDVAIPAGTAPGARTHQGRTAPRRASARVMINAPLPRAGRFQGFGPQDVIYLVMVDRFANGDTTNDEPAVSRGLTDRARPKYYHGGDLAGLRAKLPYLKQLGITAVWMTPVYDNVNTPNAKQAEQGVAVTDYHGYGPTDHYAVEEHFGDLPTLKGLVDDAHALGLKVILDFVANHVGPDHPWVNDLPTPTWFNGTPAEHLNNTWQVWSIADPHATAARRDHTLKGWFANVLPDVNQDDPEGRRYIIQNTLWWVGMTGIDGLRQDTWPYVPRSFWTDWMAAIKREYPAMRAVGEVWDGDPTVLRFFEGSRTGFDGVRTGVDALFDFPLHYPMRRAFANGESLDDLVKMLGRDHLYDAPERLVTFLGSHDVSRFMSEAGATPEGLQLAFTFQLTARGTPLIYAGDEIGMPGGADPDNRRDFPGGWPRDPRNAFTASGRTPAEQATWTHVHALLALRAARPDLATAPMTVLAASEQLLAYTRGRTLVVLNNGKAPAEVELPAASVTRVALGGCTAAAPTGATVRVKVPARTGCVY